MCWLFSTDRTSCLTWLGSTCGPGNVSRLSPGGQRSPFSFKAIPTTPASSRARDSSFITVVSERGPVPVKDRSRRPCEGLLFIYYLLLSLQRWSRMTHVPPSPELSLAGSPRPTPLMSEAACWPINANRDMTSVALTLSPVSGTCPGAAAHLRALKVGSHSDQ